MSAMNDALSKLAQAQRQSVVNLQPAQVAKVKRSRAWLWMVAGFAASLAVGGWAVSQQQAMVDQAAVDQTIVGQTMVSQTVVSQTLANQAIVNEPKSLLLEVDERSSSPALVSPTTKIVPVHRPVYQTAVVAVDKKTSNSAMPTVTVKQDSALANQQPLHSNRAVALGAESGQKISSVLIEQVDLTPEQLAVKAMSRADKAVDSNELKEALDAYSEVLRFTPDNELARQKLSALYYGKGDARKAFEILQSGIKLNHNGESLRIALAKLLIKEKQSEAALTPLVHLPDNASIDYLSLRAALAQKAKQDALALESYQRLVKLDAENARWWLGLAIAQERTMDFQAAKYTYQQALAKVGLSSQSQLFIRDRLVVLSSLEESASAN
ncbi:tetratricopeptide repeat protein [Vibrio anguillarum]|uniref:tetratricopeptide repeat protein n=1 Tax=Vibrio anguillarum TaxID=55601 RepID=UPI000B547411|nr:hypothetical protein [Vibrio anguillarum]ASG02601.1 hypothetical protein CEJ46_01585 [Vibrio anguillarum]